jgi:hypothetical protein
VDLGIHVSHAEVCVPGRETKRNRRDPYSWTVRLPERDLAELVLEFAAPLLERLGPAPGIDDARAEMTGATELACRENQWTPRGLRVH